ncbi:MAG: DUF2247 family protein [Acetatifactor sp.]|nr:DUF2247 family protein [Acetatifactor sp.]
MDLNINSPSYYTQEYGVDDDIYWMCRELSNFVKEKKYSDVINIIGIVPIIAPASVIEKGLCKAHKRCEPKSGFASVSLQIDYEEYVNADTANKKRLIIDNILSSVKAVSQKGKIDYCLFAEDVRTFCENNGVMNKTMIRLKDIKQLGLFITWRLLYLGVQSGHIETEEVIEYAIEKLEEGSEREEIRELAGAYAEEHEEICNVLWKLTEQEDTQNDIENRKIRAVIVSRVLKTKNKNCINGLMDITDLWIELGYPDDSPHIIQGKGNCVSPSEYYTMDNYNFLYEKNVEWLKMELEDLRKNNKNNYSF